MANFNLNLKITSEISELSRITKPQVAALKKLGLNTARDLLLHFPYRYLDFSQTRFVKDLKPDESVSLKVKINSISGRFAMYGRMALAEAVVSDETGSIKVVWFNQPYLAKTLTAGDEIFLAGEAGYYKNSLQLTNPIYEKVPDFPIHTTRLVPLYHLKQSLYPKTFRNLIAQVLPFANEVADELPQKIIANQGLLNLSQTIKISHFPGSNEELTKAKKRLAFEEIFLSQLIAQKHKLETAKTGSFKIKFDQKLVKKFVDALPFKLTAGQKKSAWEILQDLEKPTPMNRLLEGDVGSGKTLVALIAALQTVADEYQVVFLAPTEILAKQHYETAKKYLTSINHGRDLCYTALLTNAYSIIDSKEIKKADMQALIKKGQPALYIGTHALLEKTIKFKKLALVIIDEQHRFGVEQRAKLMASTKKIPHLLSLTATPIPRTLQLAFYRELDISQIKQKPSDRKTIITKLVTDENRPKAYEFVRNQIALGRQVFVITPLIEESDKLGVKSAKKEQENLQKIFLDKKVGLLHGRLKGKEKESVMNEFLQNQIQILVATSVVEVGVDVPNASVMVIEGAERFGLAQLHQFRGRVGRAEHQSYCFLFMSDVRTGVGKSLDHSLLTNEKSLQDNTLVRLEAFTQTQDGFELAELDLKQRGFGDLYGASQSGYNFKYFDPSYTSLIGPARDEALAILRDDLNLDNYPLLKEKIKDKVVHFE